MVIAIMVLMMVVIMIPIALAVPLIFVAVPPRMVPAPAAVALGIEIAAAVLRFVAMFAISSDRDIEPGFGLFYTMSAFIPVIVRAKLRRGEKQ